MLTLLMVPFGIEMFKDLYKHDMIWQDNEIADVCRTFVILYHAMLFSSEFLP